VNALLNNPWQPVARRASVLLYVTASVVLGGCAAQGLPISGGGGDNLSPSERRLQEAENQLVAVQRRLDGMDASLSDQSGGGMSSELRDLRGQVEELSHQVKQQDQRLRQIYSELEARIRQAEGGSSLSNGGLGIPPPIPGLGSNAGVGSPTPAASPSPRTPPAFDAQEEASYLETFELLKNGRYDEAIKGFRAHLEQYPDGQYADNAAYWMAEASYVKRDFKTAESGFQQVVTRHPDSPRAPDAMFKLALAQEELRQSASARATLEQVVRRYPNSNAARLAQQRLDGADSR
jgi:tol-pal system protein YbgF